MGGTQGEAREPMSTKTQFDELEYVGRIFRLKGHSPEHDDVMDIMDIQMPAWRDLLTSHRVQVDPDRAERILTTFGPVKTYGVNSIIEAFGEHLERQPKEFVQDPWAKAAAETRRTVCSHCEGRGVVSEIPCRSHRWDGERLYSFRCVCDASNAFPGVPVAEPWMLEFATRRNGQLRDRLRDWRRANDLESDTHSEFLVKLRRWLSKQGGKGAMFKSVAARPRAAKPPAKVESWDF